MTTPGQEALIEAMRLEQARIYGHTVREATPRQRAASAADQERRERDELIRQLRYDGLSLARIALRVGITKSAVHKALERAS